MTIGVKAPELMKQNWQLVNQVAKATRLLEVIAPPSP